MRNKSLFILILIAAITIFLSYTFLFQPQETVDPNTGFPTGTTESIFAKLKTSYDAYKLIKDVDYEAQRVESERLKSQLTFVESEIRELEASLLNIEAERAEKEILLRQEKTNEINQKANDLRQQIQTLQYQISQKGDVTLPDTSTSNKVASSDMIYSFLLDGMKDTTTAVVTFVGEKSHDGYYTVKLVGYLDSLVEALDNITANMDDYGVSIGHCSLRQIYSCYNQMRPWDQATLLKWFNSNYVTGSGQIGTITGSSIMSTIATNGILGPDTVASLTRAKNKDIEEIEKVYEEKIKLIEAERQDAIIAAYKGEPTKIQALLQSIKEYYDAKVLEERELCEAEKAVVMKTYNERVAVIGSVIQNESGMGNPDLLIYTLDITISVNTGK